MNDESATRQGRCVYCGTSRAVTKPVCPECGRTWIDTKIDEELFAELEQLGSFHRSGDITDEYDAGDQAFIDDIEDQIEDGLRHDDSVDQTEVDAVVKARKGQGRFRRNVEQLECKCRVTGLQDKRLLIASHIKPWRV